MRGVIGPAQASDDGLVISVCRAQRLYNNHKWHNPVVVKLENVTPAVETPPYAETTGGWSAEGYEIITAADGLAALEIARKEHPDLVLLDLGTAAREAPTAAPSLSASFSIRAKFSSEPTPRPPDTTIPAEVSQEVRGICQAIQTA